MVCFEEEAQPKALLGGGGVGTYATMIIITCHHLLQINIKRFLDFFCSLQKTTMINQGPLSSSCVCLLQNMTTSLSFYVFIEGEL
jgi:hypothetical protein